MRDVTRLDGDVELGALGWHIEKKPAVIDFEDVGAELPKSRGDDPEHTRPVRNGEPERYDLIPALEFAHHDGSKNARVDIAAAQDQPDLAAFEALRICQQRGEACGAG